MRLLALALAALAAGCATAPPADIAAATPRPLAAYAADPFVPVNLYLNANQQLTPRQAQLVEHVAQQLRDSGAFVRIDRGVQRWPITLQASYRIEGDTGGGDTVRRVLGALTLGLVPVHVSDTHTLFAEVFAEPETLAALELSVTARRRVSLYDAFGPDHSWRAAADALVERLLAEVAQRKLIPRWNTFKPDEPKKKKPKPPGRAT
jgi:hypothetical protein